MKDKDEQILQLKQRINKLRGNPEINEVRKEASELDMLLTIQQAIFCHKLALIHDLSKTIDSLLNQLSDFRMFYEEIDEKISEYINWKDNAQGRSADLPRIEESHNDMISDDRDIITKYAEMAIIRARNLASKFIEYITYTLLQGNLIQGCPKGTLLDVKALKTISAGNI